MLQSPATFAPPSFGIFSLCALAAPTVPVILLSIDGFRYDYLDRGVTPALSRLVADGVRAPLVPSFPSKTFPNHYTIVTGLYPGQHGIVSNNIWDPVTGETFSLSDRAAVQNPRWWGGTPVWVSVEQAGKPAAALFWPGSEAPIQGVRPAHWMPYDDDFPDAARADSILAWLDLPAGRRPAFLAWYLSDVDHAGHTYGPGTPGTDSAVARVDAAVGHLLAGLDERGLYDRVDFIVVSDHGMAKTSPDRVVLVDSTMFRGVHVLDLSPYFQVWGDSAHLAALMPKLRSVPHLTVWWRDSTPPAFHFRGSAAGPIVGVVDDGWELTTQPRAVWGRRYGGGDHGYADTLPSMRAVFVAHGPDFRRGAVGTAFRNVHIYPLLMHLLGLAPPANAGSLDSTRSLLR